MHGFIRNRVFILDISVLLKELDNCIEIIMKNLMFATTLDFKTKHMLSKYVLTNIICSHIVETNDVVCYPLLPSEIYNDLLTCNEVKIQFDLLKIMFHSIYKIKLFNFYNVEVNVDLILQGSSLYVYTYENDLE